MTNQPDAGRDDAAPTPELTPNGSPTVPEDPTSNEAAESGSKKPRILIGSQRDRGSAVPRAKRDWYVPGEEPPGEAEQASSSVAASEPVVPPAVAPQPDESRPMVSEPVVAASFASSAETTEEEPAAGSRFQTRVPSTSASLPQVDEARGSMPSPPAPLPRAGEGSEMPSKKAPSGTARRKKKTVAEEPDERGRVRRFPPPNRRAGLTADLEAELEAALGDASLDDLIATGDAVTRQAILEPESRQPGRVVAVRQDDVFVELGGREQGVVPMASFAEPPAVGTCLELIVNRFNAAEGLYELNLPHAAVSVGDWSDLNEGMVVEARVTGHNTGGLECEVNHIRGFIPVSQISLFRVEDLAQFVGEKFTCLVTEANPQRRNLILSRRAVLEREKESARRELLDSLAPGQVHEGVVRKLMDFGAFVDLGGVDGLLHVSQLGWARVNHPSDVLTEGQRIQVKIQKIDHENKRISLGYREMFENPWNEAARNYAVNMVLVGKVSKLMEFGAFVELEPGVEGLVHISELSHKRIRRASDVVAEGDEVEVMIKSVDAEAQRIGLSMKDVLPAPETEKKEEPSDEELAASMPKPTKKHSNRPLRGGLRGSRGGEQFGLKW